jgi:hypothetical protein
VPGRGLEPPIPYGNRFLKPARLPISPPRLYLIIITKPRNLFIRIINYKTLIFVGNFVDNLKL